MRIYKERGINPFASCLPTLIQFPIIIGLYQSITRALSVTPFDMLKLARTIYPFQNVEGIIPLNSTFLVDGSWAVPSAFRFLGLCICPTLAIIVALTTYVQSKLTMPDLDQPQRSKRSDVKHDEHLHAAHAWLVCVELCFRHCGLFHYK